MKCIKVLDCTLRDGGYCNQWAFGKKNIEKILNSLIAAGIDVLECGYLTDKTEYDTNSTKFSNFNQLEMFLPKYCNHSLFVVMINYGEYNIEELPNQKDTLISGIRFAFHKKDCKKAIDQCKILVNKGYKVFVQPMVSICYSEQEFIKLIKSINGIGVYAFYIVDSFGTMGKKCLNHFYHITEQFLHNDICIGFHSHNNLQGAFCNVQSLMEHKDERTVIIDSSIHGMGRGAGNLNSEIFLNNLNLEIGTQYDIKPLLQIMDEVICRFYEQKPWGYSLPNYLSAMHTIHPNYASFLAERKTLTFEAMDDIFSLITPEKGIEYDERYIRKLYTEYLSNGKVRENHLKDIQSNIKGRKILLVAPGRNAILERHKILNFVEQNHPIIISVNHNYPELDSDYIFVSNIRRFKEISEELYGKVISTSNIENQNTYASVDYYRLLNSVDDVSDNSGLMAIKFAINQLNVNEVFIAGFDGYTHDVYGNFETEDMALLASNDFFDRMNYGMREVLKEYSMQIKISFITNSLLENEINNI